MKKKSYLYNTLLSALLIGVSSTALAEITVDKSNGELNITSDINGLVIVKVIGPDDVVVVDDQYQGNSFSWSPSSGPDGAYRYDVRVIDQSEQENDQTNNQLMQGSANQSDYAGGSVEVRNGAIAVAEEEKS